MEELRQRFDRLRPIVEGLARKKSWPRARRRGGNDDLASGAPEGITGDPDMLQTGLVKLWEMLVQYKDKDDGYVIAAARNAMTDWQRYRRVRQNVKCTSEVFDIADAQPSTGEWDRPQLDVEELLADLTDRQRQAFRLHCLLNVTIRETAKQMCVSTTAVNNLITKAKSRLRQKLGDPCGQFSR